MKLLAEVVLDTGHIDADAWRTAHRDRLPVAKCACGGPAMTHPLEPESTVVGGVRWYSLRCSVCSATTELPSTRKLRDVRRPSRAALGAGVPASRRRVGERL
jgi:hypothetical protein